CKMAILSSIIGQRKIFSTIHICAICVICIIYVLCSLRIYNICVFFIMDKCTVRFPLFAGENYLSCGAHCFYLSHKDNMIPAWIFSDEASINKGEHIIQNGCSCRCCMVRGMAEVLEAIF